MALLPTLLVALIPLFNIMIVLGLIVNMVGGMFAGFMMPASRGRSRYW